MITNIQFNSFIKGAKRSTSIHARMFAFGAHLAIGFTDVLPLEGYLYTVVSPLVPHLQHWNSGCV